MKPNNKPETNEPRTLRGRGSSVGAGFEVVLGAQARTVSVPV